LRTMSVAMGPRGTVLATRLALRLHFDGLVQARRLGVKFELDLEDHIQRTMYLTGYYERGLGEFLRRSAGMGDVYLDVGANVGIHALPMARRLREKAGSVIAVEAAPDTARMLESAITKNRLENVTVAPVALGVTPGTAALRVREGYEAADVGTRTLFGDGVTQFTVNIVRGDDLLRDLGVERLDILKIDIEGGELDALRGLEKSLLRFKPRIIVAELRDDTMELRADEATTATTAAFLEEVGYHIDRGTRFGPNVVFRHHREHAHP
jgi:FkbM family methyltransferase